MTTHTTVALSFSPLFSFLSLRKLHIISAEGLGLDSLVPLSFPRGKELMTMTEKPCDPRGRRDSRDPLTRSSGDLRTRSCFLRLGAPPREVVLQLFHPQHLKSSEWRSVWGLRVSRLRAWESGLTGSGTWMCRVSSCAASQAQEIWAVFGTAVRQPQTQALGLRSRNLPAHPAEQPAGSVDQGLPLGPTQPSLTPET